MRLLPLLATCAVLATLGPGVTALTAADAPAPNATAPKAKAKAPAPKSAPAKKPRTVKMFMRDGLRFEPPRFVAEPGEEIVVEIENNDSTDQTHNFVLLRPGTRDAVVQAGLALAEKGPALEYVPPGADVLVHSRLLTAEGFGSIKFTVPTTPGIYPYVCTFPGHGMIMYGALYAGVTPPPIEKDSNIPPMVAQGAVAGGGQRPFAQRIFMPDAGPAAVAIALVGSQNVCWDAGQCRLRYAWQGSFIDASENWAGNGKILPIVPTKPWWRAPKDDFPLRFGAVDSAAPKVKFLGYAATTTGPVFHYRAGETEVYEQVLPAAGRPGIAVRLRIPRAPGPVFYRTAADPNAQWTSSAGTWSSGVLTLTPAQAVDVTLTLTSALCTP